MIENPDTGDRDFLLSLGEKIIRDNNNIIGINYVFEPDIIEDDALYAGVDGYQNDGQFITYVSNQNGSLVTSYIDNYDTYEMYYRAYQEKDDFFTEPYYFDVEGEDEYITTVVFPLTNNGEFIGLVGIDFTSSYILQEMEKIESTYERRDIIVSKDGVIVTNTADETDFGKHISTIHTEYFIGMAAVDADGYRISNMEGTGNLEVLHNIDLGSSGENWYIFSDVPMNVLMQSMTQDAYTMIILGIVLFIVYALILLFINNSVISPITDLTAAVTEFNVKTDTIDELNVDSKKLIDIAQLIASVRVFAQETQDSLNRQRARNNIRDKQLQLQNIIDTSNTKKVYINVSYS